MIFYTSFFAIVFILGLPNYLKNLKNLKLFFEAILFILLIIFSGLRYEVGGDWENYIVQFKGFANFGFPSVAIFTSSDPIYITINILSHKLGTGIELVNLICSMVFFSGYYLFVKKYGHNVLSILAPFLFIFLILSMGFSRQCLSIGFILYSLYFYIDKKYFLQVFFILLALLSHKSSIIFFIFFFISIFFNRIKFINTTELQIIKKNSLKIFFIALVVLLIFFLVIFRDLQRLTEVYFIYDRDLSIKLHQTRTSSGVIYKYPILLFFSLFYLISRNKLKFINNCERNIFDTYLILSLSILPLLGFFSLLVDRLLIYFYPFIGIFIVKFLNDCVDTKHHFKIYIFCSLLSFLMTFTWLKFANHSHFWIPYKNILFINN